ncbi:MAG: ribonuclease, Rne/Rng family [Thermoleophilia bacterium]|nr:ribonuclease, Rne/Rng family [Thermoleophilia bacterium]
MALRWFRFGKKEEAEAEAAAREAVAIEVQTPPETQAPEPTEAQDAPEGPRKRRRRGSRGGRGRKRPGAAQAAGETSEEPDDGTSDAGPAGPDRRDERTTERKTERKTDKRSQRSSRRRTPTKRAPLPAAKRELLISVDVGEQRVAILEDDRVAEVYLERPERRSIAGNIYLGVVDNVLPGMEAAFVEIGLEKNGFLYVDEIVGPELEGRKGARKIQDLIKRGQTILVQAVKDPMKSKGARLTTEISLPGRFLVYVPNGEGSGVSRRLEDAERNRLKEIVRKLDPKGGGIIVRTAAEGASAEDIERDLVFLQRLWKTIQAKAKGAAAPALVYEEAELPLRIVRDLFAGDFVGAQIDDDRTHRRIVSYLKKTSPHMIERVHRYREKAPLFEASGVDQEIRSTLERRVDLPSGGYLVFDYAEAFTVIDVNTGRFVGSRGKSAQGRLEDTIVKNNLEAVKEVVRQLRLRDIGGIIVIDFIDMANPKNRATVEEALRSELERDRTKTYVVEISPLGLVEMTRQNVTDGPREILTSRCPVCAGDGFVVSDATHALEIERKMRAIAKGSRVQAFHIALHPRVLSLIVGPGGSRLAEIEAAARRRFFLTPVAANGHVHFDHFDVLGQGKLDAMRPSAPVEEGASIDLKLVEVGLHDATAGVGKVGGYEVVVAGAAKLVGKKVTALIGRALEGTAYAMPAGDVVVTSPITFEAEAERPMRAPSRKRATDEPEVEPAPEVDVGVEVDVEVGDGAAAEVESVVEVSADAAIQETPAVDGEAQSGVQDGGQPKKKRTRRGTRGGRGRKKLSTTDSTTDSTADSTAETATADSRAQQPKPKPKPRPKSKPKPRPRIHVPPSEDESEAAPIAIAVTASAEPDATAEAATANEVTADGEVTVDGQPKRKRSRRGSRGGRNRRKPSANGDQVELDPPGEPAGMEPDESDAGVDEEPTAVADPAAEETAPEYVPMSEWIGDFGQR